MKRLFLALMACLCLFACPYTPPRPPTPDAGTGGALAMGGTQATGGASSLAGSPATGGESAVAGASSTGGASAVDGYALCVAATKANPGRIQQAKDNGMTVAQLASFACSFETVKQCFAKGICK